MSYQESLLHCEACGRETLHWRPWSKLRPAFVRSQWNESISALLRTLHLPGTGKWRCVECDHPWESTLLR